MVSTREYVDFATDAAFRAGQLTLAHFQTGVSVDRKQDASPVTIAERGGEELLRSSSKNGIPITAFFGEEMGESDNDSSHRWNGREARVSNVDAMGSAVVSLTEPGSLDAEPYVSFWKKLKNAARVVRGYSDCYGHCLVATGRCESMLDPIMNPWDSAALLPIVEEAGGTFTDWSGERTVYGGSAISTNRALLEPLMELLS